MTRNVFSFKIGNFRYRIFRELLNNLTDDDARTEIGM